jgi:hypothetical protein
MIKRDILLPLLFIVLSTVFVLIGFMIFVSGPGKRLLRLKLRTGAMMLALTASVSCHHPVQPSCYEVEAVKTDVTTVDDSILKKSPRKAIIQKEQTKKGKKTTSNDILDTIAPVIDQPRPTCYAPVRDDN